MICAWTVRFRTPVYRQDIREMGYVYKELNLIEFL